MKHKQKTKPTEGDDENDEEEERWWRCMESERESACGQIEGEGEGEGGERDEVKRARHRGRQCKDGSQGPAGRGTTHHGSSRHPACAK